MFELELKEFKNIFTLKYQILCVLNLVSKFE